MASNNEPSSTDKRFWTPARIAAICVIAGLALAIFVSNRNRQKTTNVSTTKAPANNPAPRNAPPAGPIFLPESMKDAALTTVEGDSFKLSDRAGKVLVINMWATWCGPCRIEMPELVQLSKEYQGKGVEVIGLTTKMNDPDVQKVRDFLKTQKVPYKTVWDDGTFAAPLVKAVNGPNVIPQSFVISKDGRIIKHFIGFNPTDTPAKLREVINNALNDKT